ncbi:hypothetical protein CRG98_024354 [Punica granatum]|uniref:Uncharacterized protein n=1 Tax=Punica granatum TaxID=22663 RepID=A0A2I0JG89_PUNGR|nr:hypothetical protein CRG98_024354 [Punica granatum]
MLFPSLVNDKAHCAHPNFILSGHACAKPMQCGLGVSTFPWGGTVDAREKESPFTVHDPLYLECDGDSRLDPIPHSGCTRSIGSKPREVSDITEREIRGLGRTKGSLGLPPWKVAVSFPWRNRSTGPPPYISDISHHADTSRP